MAIQLAFVVSDVGAGSLRPRDAESYHWLGNQAKAIGNVDSLCRGIDMKLLVNRQTVALSIQYYLQGWFRPDITVLACRYDPAVGLVEER